MRKRIVKKAVKSIGIAALACMVMAGDVTYATFAGSINPSGQIGSGTSVDGVGSANEKTQRDGTGNDKAQDNKLDKEKLDNDKPDESKPDGDKPDEGKPDEGNTGEDKPDGDKPDEGNTDDDKPDEGNTGEDKPDNDKPDDGNAGEDKADDPKEDDPGKDEPDDDKKDEVKLKKPVIQAASRTNGKIKISWKKVDGAAEYVLFRSTKKDAGFQKIFQKKKATHYLDEKCPAGQVYYYRLTVYDKGRDKRADSKIKKGISLEKAKLSSVSNLAGSRKLAFRWGRVKGASSYQILRKGNAGEYEKIATVKGENRSFTDKKLTGGQFYKYRVRAMDKNGGWGNLSEASSQMAIDANRKMIALTYDDGPSLYTPIVLDALEKYGAHATFFVVGNRVNQFGASIRREAALGCEIGNHTYGHNTLGGMSASQIQSVISATNRVVKNQCGVDIHVMRPPGGSYNATVLSAAGMPTIMWSIDTLDWKTRNTASTIQCVNQNAYDGAVVLMHDLHKPTADAADTIVRNMKSAGYQMVTVSELAFYRGGMTAGRAYSQFRK